MNKNIVQRLLAAVVVAGGSASSVLAGCSDLGAICRESNCLGSTEATGNSPGQGGAGSAVSSSGAGGQGGAVAESCDPSLAPNPVADSCGIFVSSSLGIDSSQGKGTKSRPYASIAKALIALSSVGGDTLYLCGETFTGAITLPSGVNIYGALACAEDWKLKGDTKSTIAAEANVVPLRIAGAESSKLRYLKVSAANATSASGNSIAMLVEGATVELDWVELIAGVAGTGQAGSSVENAAPDGKFGVDAQAGCTSIATVPAATAAFLDCGNDQSTEAGTGGFGAVNSAGVGNSGESTPAVANPNGGSGQSTNAACTNGKVGFVGAFGIPGDGATGLGALDSQHGFVGVAGGDGKTKGLPGQGGGGGGGASGKLTCQNTTYAGPAGASGGTGGCGGAVGNGGLAGGSSMALVSLGANITLKHVALTAKQGGSGGKGGDGQLGGQGRMGGFGKIIFNGYACAGGAGGNGGRGGAGGGGIGGHSIGVAYTGSAPMVIEASVTTTLGAPGFGGVGGFGEGMATMGGQGAVGIAAETHSFDAP